MGLGLVFGCTVLVELYVLRRWLKVDWLTVAIVVAGTLLWVDYLSYTSVTERNYDGEAHVEYAAFVARHWRLPDAASCVACGHPPLYYVLAAAWSKLVTALTGLSLELGLQWLSLLLSFGFVATAVALFRTSGARPGTLRLATALVVFWPSTVINSVRVHNDALASLLLLAAIHFLAAWDRMGKSRHFHAALGACAVALLTKASGYALFACLLGFAALRLGDAERRREGVVRLATAVVVLAVAAGLAVGSRSSATPSTPCQMVLGQACSGRYRPVVPDTPARFLGFDVATFVAGLDAPPDQPQRDYFLNRFAKSSLFGVMPLGEELTSRRHQALAVALRVLLLLLVGLCLGTAPFLLRRLRQHRVYIVAPLFLFAFLVAFRVRAPNEFHEDFRHVFPVLVPFGLAYASGVQRLERASKVLGMAATGVGLTLLASSVAFFARSAVSPTANLEAPASPVTKRVVRLESWLTTSFR